MADFRFRRISHYRYETLTGDGADIRGTIKAPDYESAENALEQEGLFVYDLKEVDAPEDLEKRCPECNHQNNWTDMVCANCGAAVRAPHVGPDEDVKLTELPEDLVVRENSDGSITLTKETDWKQFAPAISFLGAIGLFCVIVIVRSVLEHNDRATRLAGIMLALFGVVVLAAWMLCTQFNREEWRVARGFVEQRKSLFGMDQGHMFRLGIIRFSDYNQLGEHTVVVSIQDRETRACFGRNVHVPTPPGVRWPPCWRSGPAGCSTNSAPARMDCPLLRPPRRSSFGSQEGSSVPGAVRNPDRRWPPRECRVIVPALTNDLIGSPPRREGFTGQSNLRNAMLRKHLRLAIRGEVCSPRHPHYNQPKSPVRIPIGSV